ncbi:MAG: putative quinol monooxygenase [Geodermatophilaceae bacterium]
MIIVAGWLKVDAEDRDRYVAECVPVVEQARTATGCLDFTIAADPIAPDRVNVYERWETDADVERFRGSGPDASRPPRSAMPRSSATGSRPPKMPSRRLVRCRRR